MFVLHVTRGPDQGKKLLLQPGKTYTVGCNEDASLVLTDPLVLKGHCSLEVSNGAVILRNHTATAGTFVGDQKVSQATLKPNGTFRVGATVLGIGVAPAAPRKPEPPAAAPDPLIGRIVGGYKLNELVGAGGMGKVYRATQLSLHREVAFKVLRDQHAKDKNFRDLFINEARAAAQLIHSNVVQVYDAGNEGDLVFFSMEFVGQGSIEEILQREKKIPWEQAILQVLEAAHGLAYAESKGIVHRDIKPDNLMLNEDGRVKIADLGLAKKGEGARDGSVIGTPHFIPPEQALGKQVDQRADIYSLGATFFRMITGQTLFTGKTAKEIVLKHIKEPPPAASSIDDSIPDDLDLVLAKMLAKDPESRYQSATEVIAALEEVCANHGIKGAIIRRGVGKRVLIPLFALLLAAGFAIYYFAYLKPEDPAKIAERERMAEAQKKAEEKAKEEAQRAELANRKARKQDAINRFNQRTQSQLALQLKDDIKSVYDDSKTAPGLEAQWLSLANEFDDFAEQDLAKEFEEEEGLSSKAKRHATEIREELNKWKESADDRAEKQKAKLKEAKDIDAKLRTQLVEMRVKKQYQKAANLCESAGTGKPPKEDPFAPIQTWEWVSPVDVSLRRGALEFPSIKESLENSRTYFQGEYKNVLEEARIYGESAIKEAQALPEEADPKAIDAAIKKLKEVRAFVAEGGERKVELIEQLVSAARSEQERLEGIVARRLAKMLADDRRVVRDVQRTRCSLLHDQIPNSAMNCDFENVVKQWNNYLVGEKIKSDLYRRFAKERIAMAGWCEYLFARFLVDLEQTVKAADGKAFKSLDIDIIPDPNGEVKDASLSFKDADRYAFSYVKGRTRGPLPYGDFPMDWVYSSVFCHNGEPRWEEMTPQLHFALGAFCFETMQYREAARHFDAAVNDEQLGKAARSFRARAEVEARARAAYETFLREFDAATTSAAMEALKGKLEGFRQEHEGTIFYLDVVDPTNPADDLKLDFFRDEFEEVPQPPPPPEPTKEN